MLNDIKSKITLKKIFGNLLKIKVLKIIKYNKKISDKLNKLNITIKNFSELYLIKRLNKNYNLNIENSDIEELIFADKKCISEILKDISKIEFKNLEHINLNKNEFNKLDIKLLEKYNFPKLEELYLISDNISDLSVLAKVNFKELKQLEISFNKITNIKILEKVNFQKLEILDLGSNQYLGIRDL